MKINELNSDLSAIQMRRQTNEMQNKFEFRVTSIGLVFVRKFDTFLRYIKSPFIR